MSVKTWRAHLVADVVEECIPAAVEVGIEHKVPPLPPGVHTASLAHPSLGHGLLWHFQGRLHWCRGLLPSPQKDLVQRLEAQRLRLQSLDPVVPLLHSAAPTGVNTHRHIKV